MQREYPIQLLCEVLEVSRSCYYAWKKGQTYQVTQKNKTMEGRVIDVFRQNKRRYGSRRIVADLRNQGHTLSRYKARKLLSSNGLKAIQPRSFVPKTTNSRHRYKISPNLLKERTAPDGVNEVWVGDISYIPLTNGSFLYLAVWMDLFSRKVVGWDLQGHMRESLVIASLQKAIGSRNIKPGLLIHTDRGGQYAGAAFRKILDACNMQQSMSDADNPYDNAHMESFFSRFKTEMLEGGAFQNAEDSRIEIFEFIEMYYNPRRLHSSIGYLSPNTYEKNK
jgi:transposase InsO family protein